VGGERCEIDVELGDIDREAADALGGIGMESDAQAAGDGADLVDRLDGAWLSR
jgi:hypothetical protein